MKDASCFLWAPGAGGLLSCSPSGLVVNLLWGYRDSPPNGAPSGLLPRGYGSLCMPPGFTRSCLGGLCSLVWAGFPVAPEGFNAVLGKLARWFYPFGPGAHCNNYYYYY